MKIAVFYHCYIPGDQSIELVIEQCAAMKYSGLYDAADQIIVGLSSSEEYSQYLYCFLPKAEIHLVPPYGEAATVQIIQRWLPDHPGWGVCYHHSKSHNNWRRCMQGCVVENWRQCIRDLESGCDAVGAHWITPNSTQQYFAGNFWWSTSSYLSQLPPIDTKTVNGKSYESEVWIGKIGRRPRIVDYARHHPMACPP